MKNWLSIILVIIGFLAATYVVYSIQMDMDRKFIEYCNEKYGEGNWTVISVYDPRYSRLSLVYECVPKEEVKGK